MLSYGAIARVKYDSAGNVIKGSSSRAHAKHVAKMKSNKPVAAAAKLDEKKPVYKAQGYKMDSKSKSYKSNGKAASYKLDKKSSGYKVK